MNWYYLNTAEEIIGPLSVGALYALKDSGNIHEDTLVCPEGEEEWRNFTEAFTSQSQDLQGGGDSFKFGCDHCGQNISAETSLCGVATQCPRCGGEIVVPTAVARTSTKAFNSNITKPAEAKPRLTKTVKTIVFPSIGALVLVGASVALLKARSSNPNSVSSQPPTAEQSQSLDNEKSVDNEEPPDPTDMLLNGFAYYAGEGVTKDYEEADKWFRKAAELGNLTAIHYLGLMQLGNKPSQSEAVEACKWWQISADGGFAESQLKLGMLYAMGFGVERNLSDAYFWLNLAATTKNGDMLSQAVDKDQAVEFRNQVEKDLSQSQIQQAQLRSRNWSPKPVKASSFPKITKTTKAAENTKKEIKSSRLPESGLDARTDREINQAIDSIAEIYPELTRFEQFKKLEQIGGVRITDYSSARRARQMVETLKAGALAAGNDMRESFDMSVKLQGAPEETFGAKQRFDRVSVRSKRNE